jgi:6-phosphogluconolactonase (cycloisomerase 2 family)
MTISKDNRFAYVATPSEIQTYNLNDTTGDLKFISSIERMNDGTSINWAYSLIINNSSDYLYLATMSEICVFNRNITTGELTPIQTIENETSPTSNITNCSIVISKDDQFLYTSLRKNLYIYKINSTTGFLSPIDTIKNLNNVEYMSYDVSCSISPDNNYIYITGGHGISVYKRNLSTGLLDLKQEIVGDNFMNDVLTYARESEVSSNNKFLYTLTNSYGTGAVVVLSRDETSDTLSIIQAYRFYNILTEMVNPISITISPNHKALCVSSENKMTFLKINTLSGEIEPLNTYNSSSSFSCSAGGRKTYDLSNRFLYNSPAFNDSIFIYKLNLFLNSDQDLCAGDTLILSPYTKYNTYDWSTGSKDSMIKVFEGGAYTLIATDLFHNNFQDTVFVTVNNLPVVDLGRDTSLYKNQDIYLGAGSNFQDYYWNIYDNHDSIIHDSYIYILNDYKYTHDANLNISLLATDNKGCSNSDTVKITLLNSTTGINNFENKTFNIYPNPAEDYLCIEVPLNNQEKIKFYIYSVSGQLIYQGLADNFGKMNISSLPKGVYIIRINCNKKAMTKKFIKI